MLPAQRSSASRMLQPRCTPPGRWRRFVRAMGLWTLRLLLRTRCCAVTPPLSCRPTPPTRRPPIRCPLHPTPSPSLTLPILPLPIPTLPIPVSPCGFGNMSGAIGRAAIVRAYGIKEDGIDTCLNGHPVVDQCCGCYQWKNEVLVREQVSWSICPQKFR